MTIRIGTHTFDRVRYDAGGDVLYLHKGEPGTAVDFDETPEGHALRFDADGALVGLTIVGPKRRLERYGKVEVTLPEHLDLDAGSLAEALVAA
jgi:uncharacterized protein YuzE